MAILSPTIRRSLHRVLARTSSSSKPLTNANNAALRSTQVISRRAVHATSAVSGDALDMADTFSRRHGKFGVCWICFMHTYLVHIFVHIMCTLLIAIIISSHTPSHLCCNLSSLHHKTIIIYL